MELTEEQVREFAERGYVVVPDVVPQNLVDEASRTIDKLTENDPPDADHTGYHFYFPTSEEEPSLLHLLTRSPAFAMAETLIGPGAMEVPLQIQVALNIPPWEGLEGHHIDGRPPEVAGEWPGTFTMLGCVLLSDESAGDRGNLNVWPGTHLKHAEYFREHGPDALLGTNASPPIELPEPVAITGKPGDLLLAHYMLGHNVGGNKSSLTRRAVYYRLAREGHKEQWRDALRDAWLEYDGVRPFVQH